MKSNAFHLALVWAVIVASALAAAPEKGLTFDGTDIWTAPAKELQLNRTALTVSAWVRLSNLAKSQVFLNRGQANTQFTFYLFKGRVRMLVKNTSAGYLHASVEQPEPNVWTHYAGTYDGKTIRLYVNGALQATQAAPGKIAGSSGDDLFIGSLNDHERRLKGQMQDIRIWSRSLSQNEVGAIHRGETGADTDRGLVAHWTDRSQRGKRLASIPPATLDAERLDPGSMLTLKPADGFRGIWYFNQKVPGSEYVYKYSGGLGTYCAKHIPMAWYDKTANKTFFCYGGTNRNNSTLYHMVSYFDHATGMLARPVILLDKKTTDAHDNPVINVDDKGYIWIFSSSHGTGRPSYISRSEKPRDIRSFVLVWTGNFSYPQPWFLPGQGFLFLHTYYKGGRGLNTWTSQDGANWTERTLVSHIEMGQYQVSFRCGGKVGTAFNMHPRGKGLNWRTNLYYIETADFGKTWRTADGTTLATPLKNEKNPALVADFHSKGRNVYMKDVNYDSKGNPIILVLTSGGYKPGPVNDPRTWTTARWTGAEWEVNEGFHSDNNYDTGPLYVETDTTWRVIAPTETGPQPGNPGGEIAMWLTKDAGQVWTKVRQMTVDSDFNHTYVRRPVNAQPEFYGIWADGHGRRPSKSRLYYCNRQGDVFRMPETMTTPLAKARKVGP